MVKYWDKNQCFVNRARLSLLYLPVVFQEPHRCCTQQFGSHWTLTLTHHAINTRYPNTPTNLHFDLPLHSTLDWGHVRTFRLSELQGSPRQVITEVGGRKKTVGNGQHSELHTKESSDGHEYGESSRLKAGRGTGLHSTEGSSSDDRRAGSADTGARRRAG